MGMTRDPFDVEHIGIRFSDQEPRTPSSANPKPPFPVSLRLFSSLDLEILGLWEWESVVLNLVDEFWMVKLIRRRRGSLKMIFILLWLLCRRQ